MYCYNSSFKKKQLTSVYAEQNSLVLLRLFINYDSRILSPIYGLSYLNLKPFDVNKKPLDYTYQDIQPLLWPISFLFASSALPHFKIADIACFGCEFVSKNFFYLELG